jgi:outer membrane protein assembly factor BamB
MKCTVIILVSCGLVAVSPGAERLVPGQYARIQEAIDASQNGDVVIVQPGTYHESINFRGKAITVRTGNPDSWQTREKTIIAGWKTMSTCVTFDQGETNTSVLEGFTLLRAVRGRTVQSDAGPFWDAGGGVLCVNSSPTIRNCRIEANTARFGAGIAMFGACRARIVNCLITHNWAAYIGGAILIRREVAMPVGAPVARRETSGQRLLSTAGDVSSFADGTTGASSQSEDGPAIINCTIADNETCGYGRGEPDQYDVDCWDAKPLILNTIICGSQPSLLIADLSAVSHCFVREAHLFQGDYKSSAAIADIASMSNSLAGFPGFIKVPNDPIDEGDYGVEYHLDANSPCIDAGSPTGLDYVQRDMDGQPRRMGVRIDIGADEVSPELVVTSPQPDSIWVAGSTQPIRWSGSLYEGTVDILFSQDAGDHWLRRPVAQNRANTGSYFWQVPETIDSNTCLISVVPHTPDVNVVQVDSGKFTIHPDSPHPQVASVWSSLGGNAARSALSEFKGPGYACLKWKFETDGAAVASVTVGFDKRVHVACKDGKLYTLDADGRSLWTCTMDSPVLSSPTIGLDGSLFVGTEDGTLHAIDVSGKLRWTYRTGGAIYSSPAVASSGNVYVGSADGAIYALANDGSELWRFCTRGPGLRPRGAVFASPAIGIDGSVYVAGVYDPNLYALHPHDGSVKWVCTFKQASDQSQATAWPFASPVVAKDGTIYQVLLHDPHLYAIEPERGTILWATDLTDPSSTTWPAQGPKRNGDGWSEPALGPDGTIYVSTNDPCLRAITPSGRIKGISPLGEVGAFTLTVDKRGYVYAACEDGGIYIVRPDGSVFNWLATGGLPTFPALAADDMLIVPDSTDYSLLITDVKNTVSAFWSKCSGSQL